MWNVAHAFIAFVGVLLCKGTITFCCFFGFDLLMFPTLLFWCDWVLGEKSDDVVGSLPISSTFGDEFFWVLFLFTAADADFNSRGSFSLELSTNAGVWIWSWQHCLVSTIGQYIASVFLFSVWDGLMIFSMRDWFCPNWIYFYLFFFDATSTIRPVIFMLLQKWSFSLYSGWRKRASDATMCCPNRLGQTFFFLGGWLFLSVARLGG